MLLALSVALSFVADAARRPTRRPASSTCSSCGRPTSCRSSICSRGPGCLLVSARNPHALMHVAAALRTARGRDVVVMTVRLLGVDVDEDAADDRRRRRPSSCCSRACVALAERYGAPGPAADRARRTTSSTPSSTAVVRLQVVGGLRRRVGDAVGRRAGAAARRGVGAGAARPRRRSTSGWSSIIAAAAPTPITSARTPPALSARRSRSHSPLWLDAAKAIGPHVHHHDVVRAALTQMEQQLNGPEREDALRGDPARSPAGRRARRRRPHARLPAAARHGPQPAARATSPSCSTDLSLEDQVVVFRLLPRKDAAATFEYLVAATRRKRC